MDKSKMLVIGIDGACWPLINEWIEEGDLPNIKNLRDNGTWGDMRSCIPPVTFPAWKCYSTGKNPGKLGVFWWEYLDIENKRSIIPNSHSFDSKEVWDYLNNAGYSTGVIGMPSTYPPKKVKGFMVSGGPDAGVKDFTYPKSLEKDLAEEFDYTTRPEFVGGIKENSEDYVEKAINQIKLNFEISKYLLGREELDFLQICSFEANGPLQHFFYNEEPTKRAWKVIDKYIGELKDKFEYIVIHSDHGTSPMTKQFFINCWLEQEGYLVRKRNFWEYLTKLGFNRENIMYMTNKLRINNVLKNIGLFKSLFEQIPTQKGLFGEKEGKAIFQKVNWRKTKLVGSAQGPLYLNKSIMDEDEQEKLKDEVIEKLNSFYDPETGKKPVEKVYRKEDIYHGKYTENAPDLVALDSDEYHNKGGVGKNVMFSESKWKGNNALNGLFLISGKGIKKGKRVNIDIYDLAPTLLHIFNTPIPTDLDGKVIGDAFDQIGEIIYQDSKAQREKRVIGDIARRGGL